MKNPNEFNFKDTLEACKAAGFNEDITRETLWNVAYQLGRSRWHWGPMWWVNFKCEFKSRVSNFFKRGATRASITLQ